MSVLPKEVDRQVVPRWRQLQRTDDRELSSASGEAKELPGADEELRSKLLIWEREASLESAVELTEAAIILGRQEVAKDAAQFVRSSDDATPQSKLLAERLVRGKEGLPDVLQSLSNQHQEATKAIHFLRHRTIDFPRNSFLRVEAARAYLVLGQNDQARRELVIALKLNPENRFVLRAAARFFTHVEDFDFAYDLLRRSNSSKNDPWVMASEIALSVLSSKSSKLIRTARDLISSQRFSPFQIGELATAIGTIENSSGAEKRAKKLFKIGLADPNDNALAQGAWAMRHFPNLNVELPRDHLKLPNSHEARVIQSRKEKNWRLVVHNCRDWLRDEPFSSRPAELASYTAISLLNDAKLGEQFAQAGLMANPNHTTLRNNLAVALCYQGRLEEAEKVLNGIPRLQSDQSELVAQLATQGLLCYRRGDAQKGRHLYEEAIETAKRNKLRRGAISALVHLANEAFLAQEEDASNLIQAAKEQANRLEDKELLRSVDVVEKRASNIVKRTAEQLYRSIRFAKEDI